MQKGPAILLCTCMVRWPVTSSFSRARARLRWADEGQRTIPAYGLGGVGPGLSVTSRDSLVVVNLPVTCGFRDHL